MLPNAGITNPAWALQATRAEIERSQSLPKIDPPSGKSIQTSISLGTEFLRLDQNPDGSWLSSAD